MARSPQIAVVGAGALGGWTALELVRRGASVTLVDAWGPGNLRSSSSGERRLFRSVYGPDAFYVPLVAESLESWRSLESEAGLPLVETTGLLWLFSADDAYVRDARASLDHHGFEIEELSRATARRRFPALAFDDLRSIYFEPGAGMLAARRSTRVTRDLFVAGGGSYRCARALSPLEDGASLDALELAGERRLEADAYVFACGPWLGELLPEALGSLIRPSRQEEFYLGPPAGAGFGPESLPPWLDFSQRMRYGVPAVEGRGAKVADDTRGAPFDPTDGDRTASRSGLRNLRRFLARRAPALAEAPLLEARVCQYENSPDGHPIVDRHPRLENVWIAGGGSGHAFKLAPAIGRLVAAMVLDGAKPLPELGFGRLEKGEGAGEESASQYRL